MMVNCSVNGRPSLSTAVNKSTLARSRSSPTSSSLPYNNKNDNVTHNRSQSVPGGELRDEILDGLDLLLETYQRAKRLVVNDVLLLRYVWLEADKDQSNTIKPNEIGGVLDKINYCQLKKSQLSDLYDNFAKVIALDKKQRKLGLTFEQTCTLLHKIKRDSWVVKPVNQYWNVVSYLTVERVLVWYIVDTLLVYCCNDRCEISRFPSSSFHFVHFDMCVFYSIPEKL